VVVIENTEPSSGCRGAWNTPIIPYIDCWQDAVLNHLTWLKPQLEEACRVMVAKEAAASKCRGKCKKLEKPILVGDPEEFCPFLYHCTD
jgi:hypothetical protein